MLLGISSFTVRLKKNPESKERFSEREREITWSRNGTERVTVVNLDLGVSFSQKKINFLLGSDPQLRLRNRNVTGGLF